MKFLAILFAFFAFNAMAVIGSPDSTYVNNLGTVEKYDKTWIMVYNGTGSTINRGSVVVFDTTADDGYTITSSTTFGVASACVTDEAIANGKKGLCLIRGKHDAVLFKLTGAETLVAYELAYHSDTAFYAAPVAAATATYPMYMPIGYALDTCNATGTCDMFIDIK